MAVYFACLEPGDTILAMNLAHGGHLTHGMHLNFSGKLYKIVPYGVRKDDERIDFDQVAALASEHKPKLIVAGASAYSRDIDFSRFAEICQGGRGAVHGGHGPHRRPGRRRPAPQPGAVGRLRHLDDAQDAARPAQRLRPVQARSGRRRSTQAVFPGMQGGPLMHVVAAKAIGFGEALQPAFRGLRRPDRRQRPDAGPRTDGTQASASSPAAPTTTCMLVDVTSRGLTGKVAEKALDAAGITVNRNGIPFDTRPPLDPSGIRIGTPALTTRGMRETEMRTDRRLDRRGARRPGRRGGAGSASAAR